MDCRRGAWTILFMFHCGWPLLCYWTGLNQSNQELRLTRSHTGWSSFKLGPKSVSLFLFAPTANITFEWTPYESKRERGITMNGWHSLTMATSASFLFCGCKCLAFRVMKGPPSQDLPINAPRPLLHMWPNITLLLHVDTIWVFYRNVNTTFHIKLHTFWRCTTSKNKIWIMVPKLVWG